MNRYALKLCLGIVLCLVFFDSSLHEPQSAEKPAAEKLEQEKFCVTIWPKTTRIQINKRFDVTLRVVNATDKVQTFEVSVAWVAHWKLSDNSKILWTGEAALNYVSTYPVQKRLEPGEAYEQPAQLIVDRDPGTAVISFQMGFVPLGEKKIIWSNRVVLGFKPNESK